MNESETPLPAAFGAKEGDFSREKAQDLFLSEKELKILCCCAPAYSHEDTELMA
ncbi:MULTISPECIES: hypothetical protein [unclassified Methanosarcina]|uniref:hypothetical protein n=1 Tax=unclassified Methanosarcina TaxID=2644672 RepID=UPI0012E0B292|nr:MULTISPECIES: hypothetical protein [unclassified Methanosarcina]